MAAEEILMSSDEHDSSDDDPASDMSGSMFEDGGMFDAAGSLKLTNPKRVSKLEAPETSEMSGYLVKKSGAFSRHLRRFFVLRDCKLSCAPARDADPAPRRCPWEQSPCTTPSLPRGTSRMITSFSSSP